MFMKDHHCAWTDACVGSNNHRGFFLFVFSSNVTLSLVLYLGAQYFMQMADAPGAVVSWNFLGFASEQDGYTFLMLCFTAWTLLMHFLIFKQQVSHISSNETMYERARKKVGRPCLPPPLDEEPFNRGTEQNVLQFLQWPGHRVDWSRVHDVQQFFASQNHLDV